MTGRVRGQFRREWHDRNGAHTEIFLENANPREVQAMFTEAPPDRFFQTATMTNRRVFENGQEGDENPLGKFMGGVPLMHTRIEKDPHGGVRGQFTGFLRGQAPVDIQAVPGGVRVVETGTTVRPDFTAVPVIGPMQRELEDRVPILGGIARAMRTTGEAMMGEVFGRVHTAVARHGGSAEHMAESINNYRKNGRW